MPTPGRILVCGWLALLFFVGCTPALYPLYEDYRSEVQSETVVDRIEHAFTDAGWTLIDSEMPNVVVGAPRRVRNWGLYRVVASVEAVVMDDGYVRLFIHPYRHYVTGNRSKIPFLKRPLRRGIVLPLKEALEQQDLTARGNDVYRDYRR